MRGQYEQAFNAESLRQIGVSVLPKLDENYVMEINTWLNYGKPIHIDYSENTQKIVDDIITNHIVATELSEKLFQHI